MPVFVSAQTRLAKSLSDRAARLRSQMPKLTDTAAQLLTPYCLIVYLLCTNCGLNLSADQNRHPVISDFVHNKFVEAAM